MIGRCAKVASEIWSTVVHDCSTKQREVAEPTEVVILNH